jgi:WD40 repeat protein
LRTMKRSMVALAAMLLVTGATWCLAREMQVPAEYPTIQAAIEAAQDGDTILIAPGTYRENLAVAKNITLVGADRDTVFLDGGGTDVVTVASGGALVLKSLTVTNGREGISVRRGGRIALINVRVVANKRDGVLVMGTAELQGCLVRDSGRYGVNVFGPGAQILGSGNILWNNLEGNIQGETPTTFQVPAGPPTPRVGLAPDAWTNVNGFTLTIGADYPAQIVATWYKMGSSPTSATDGTRLAGLQFTVESPAEGAVPMWVWIEDELGLKDHRKAVRVVLKWDKTPPVIVAKITPEPNSAGWNNSDVVVSFECTDALSGMASCTPGEPVSLTQEGKGQVVKAVAVDNAGNKAEREVVVNLDKTRPEIVLGAPLGTLGIENWYRSDVTVPYTATDTLSGFPGGKTTTEGTVTTTGEGPDRTVVIRVTDLAGNTAEAKAGPFKVDKTPPVIVAKITPEPNSAGWNNSDVVVSFECTDALSGMASCTPGEPVSLTQEGKGQVVKAVAVDNAGNKAEREVVVNLDKTRPEIVLGAPLGTLGIENWYRSDVTVPYTATDTLSGFPGGKTTTEGTVTTTGEGPDRTVVIRVTDLAGNTAEAKAGPFKVDKTPPVARIVLDPATPNGKEGWYTMPVKVHYECSDPLSGLDPATPPPSDTTLTTDGIHHLTLEVRDKAGNAAPVVTVDVKLDQTPPVVRATPPDTTRWYREDVQVPCTASDATSGLANSGDANFTLLAKGEGRAVSTGTRTVADRAGNTTTVGPFTFQIDKNPPVIVAKITPEPNSAGWNNSDVVVSFECTDALSGMASCTPGEPVSLTQEGKGQVVKAVAVDNAGNKAEREVVVNLDKTRPEIVLGAPLGTLGIENWYRSDVTVPYTATDTLSGFPGGKTTTEGTVTTTGEGPDRTVVIRVTDLAGNTAEAKAGPFKVDKTPPVARIVLDPATPNGKEGWYTMPVKVHYECSDPLSGLDPATPPPSDTTLTTDGIHHLTLEVRDKAGNAAPVVTVDVKLDQTPPVVRATPPDTTRWYREDVQVPCTASDATSGLANSGDANFTLLAKGEGRAVSTGTRTVADRAGNTTTVGPFTFQIDKNPPVIVAKITPEPNSAGWNNSDVVVSFECTDALSGMASCSPPVTLTREGRDQVVQGEAVDNAGNRATTSLKLNLDKTAPSGSLAILADEGFETGDFALLPWRSGGSLPWVVQSSVVRSGSYAARAGAIGHNSSSWLELNLSLGAGTVSFWYRVSSESGYDYLRFYVDGVEKAKWSGETGWQYASLSVTAGTHTLRWEYSKDVSVVAGSDTAWLDDIRLPVSASPSVRVSEPVVALALSAQDNLSGVAEARFSNDGQSWSAWETFASTKGSWDLTAFGGTRTLGLKTIHAQVRDRAGNASAAFTVSFRLISIPYLGHTGLVRAVAFSPDGKSIVSGSWDDTIRVWEVASGSAVSVLARHTSDVNAVAFSPDGKNLASASDDRTVKVWDAATGRELQSLRSHTDSVMAVAFSPDGKYVASGSKDKTIRLWDVATGQLVKTITGHAGTVTSLVYLGSWRLASGSEDGTVILWEMPTGWKERTLQGHTAGVNAVAYSAETRLLASGSSDKTIRLWDAFTGESKGVLTGHTDSVLSVQFSPNGKFLVSGSADRTVRVWDVATGQVLRVLVGHTDAVMSVGYSPDGKVVVSGSRDGTVRLWDVSDLVGR